ncbi:periplasmic heavy metal sensor [Rhodovulum sp. DZ06]|uniref:periplasmic heavy metal sensor n=1 Tax=Rhodovulum sp. DZ06 TaxID=3425126 RepID=UPI003D327830
MTDDKTPPGPDAPDPQTPESGGPAAAPPRRRRRWVGWALAASLCLNLLLLGGMAGAFLRHGPPGASPAAGLDAFTLHRMMHRLPDEQRDAARDLFRAHRPDFDALRPRWRETRAAVAAALGAEPFDPEALRDALRAARQAEVEGKGLLDQAMVEFAAGLPAETRAELVEELGRRRWHGKDRDGWRERHRGGDGDDDDDDRRRWWRD